MIRIGVLALQGDFAKHIAVLRALGVDAREVRRSQDLVDCDGLIIPGGESTVIVRRIDYIGMKNALLEFASTRPVFGTCAGIILMSRQIEGSPFQPLQLLDIAVARNAFGRQVESFQTSISLELVPHELRNFSAFFIRAPRIINCGEGVEVLARFQDEPILVRQGHHLGATFHPELTDDPQVHEYFIAMVQMR